MLLKSHSTITELAQLVGTLVSCLPGVQFGQLHYRNLEIAKNLALRKHKGNYEAQLTLSSSAKGELSWWIENVNEALIQFHIKILSLNLELMLQKRGGACIWMVTLPKAYSPFRKASRTSMS